MNTRLLVATNVANLYAAPSTNAEVVSQAVLGEVLTVEQSEGVFHFVHTKDLYRGWVRQRCVVRYVGDITGYAYRNICVLFAEVYAKPNASEEIVTRLPLGARVAVLPERVEAFQKIMLPDLTEAWVLKFALQGEYDITKARTKHWTETRARRQTVARIGEDAVEVGKRLIGTPYLWGGKTPFGIDCSGFTQLCYQLGGGVSLLRDASLQFRDKRFVPIAETVSLLDVAAGSANPFEDGDLLFFGSGDKITHVGMVAHGRVMHAAGGLGVVWQPFSELAYAKDFIGARRLSRKCKTLALEAA
jgi:cell wall-associated NlpC family hydrolase